MELKFDTSKTYAVALEGGGAKGRRLPGDLARLDEVVVHVGSGNAYQALLGKLGSAFFLELKHHSQTFL